MKTPAVGVPLTTMKTVSAPKTGGTAVTKPAKAGGYNPIGNLGDYAHPPAKKGRKK